MFRDLLEFYGPDLAAVAVGSVAWPPGQAQSRLSRAIGGSPKKNKRNESMQPETDRESSAGVLCIILAY